MMKEPRVHPDIRNVRDLFIVPGFVAEQGFRLEIKPGVDAVLFDEFGYSLQQL